MPSNSSKYHHYTQNHGPGPFIDSVNKIGSNLQILSLNSHLVSKIFVFSLLCPYYSTCSKCHKTYEDCASLKQLNYRYVRALRQKCNDCDFESSKSNTRVLRIVTVKAVETIPAALRLILMEISYHFVLQSESIPFSIFLSFIHLKLRDCRRQK